MSRKKELDIIKGICIVFIVLAHAGYNTVISHLFYVTAFYWVAGYTFREKRLLDFILSKIKRLYLPFVVFNGGGWILWNLISKMTNYSAPNQKLSEYIFNILSFNLKFNLMAPGWFAFPLFLISFIFYGIKKLIKDDKIILGFTAFLFLYTCKYRNYWMKNFFWNDCAWITNVGIGLFLYELGCLSSKYEIMIKTNIMKYKGLLLALGWILYLMVLESGFGFDIRQGFWTDGLMMSVISIIGVYFVYGISVALSSDSFGLIKNAFAFLGKRSMIIMYFHIPAFSIAIIIIHIITGLEFPNSWTNAYEQGIYKYITALIGIIIPVLGFSLYEKIKDYVKRYYEL